MPRKEYAMVDPEDISITELYRLVGAQSVCSPLAANSVVPTAVFVLDVLRTGCSRFHSKRVKRLAS